MDNQGICQIDTKSAGPTNTNKTAFINTNKVVCIDTGRYCDAMYYGSCAHQVKLIHDDGSWTNLGMKMKDDIISLHEKYGLTMSQPEHFHQ